jgi:ABC-type bacteriocin/lantibiotic exporter with double-glycine peptidase domain
MIPFIFIPVDAQQVVLHSQIQAPLPNIEMYTASASVADVPFYSQFKDIQSPKWQKVGCGITSLAMIINFYKPESASVNTLLNQGVALGAYDQNAGWTYKGLITLSQKYGFDGNYYDLSKLNTEDVIGTLKNYLKDGPIIVSAHYKFDPKSTIPHLVVIDGIDNGVVYYNDPASNKGKEQIYIANFLGGWKKRIIVIRPIKTISEDLLAYNYDL